jgi:uncharacterized glyoxalase superfamily protein PhnB
MELKRIKRAEAAETVWTVRFGMLADRFGIPWVINSEKSE